MDMRIQTGRSLIKKLSRQRESYVQKSLFGAIKKGKEKYCGKSVAQIKSILKTNMKEDDSHQFALSQVGQTP